MNKRGIIKLSITGISLLVIALLIPIILFSKTTTAIINQQTYTLNENVKINLNDKINYKLIIETPSNIYIKEGNQDSFVFNPTEIGFYTLKLTSNAIQETYEFQVINSTPNTPQFKILGSTSISQEDFSIFDELNEEDQEEELIQEQAEINKPVKWRKRVIKNSTQTKAKIPKERKNLRVEKITTPVTREIITNISITNLTTEQEIEIKREDGFYELTYETEAPKLFEESSSEKEKLVTISSNLHYQNVLAKTTLPQEAPKELIKLYWVKNGTQEPFREIKYIDTNNNSLIDEIQWLVPHLSNQTFNISLDILTIQSYPTVGGNWTVKFTTLGTADLKITAVNGTTWNNFDESQDLKFLEVKCGFEIQTYQWINNSVFIPNYSCNETASEISKVLTEGSHHLEFDFGGTKAYAHNYARRPPVVIMLSNAGGDVDNDIEQNITWSTQDRVDTSAFTHTSGESNITVQQDGVYRVTYGIYITQAGAGADRYQAVAHVTADGANTGSCYDSGYNRGSSSSQDLVLAGECLLNLTTGQEVRVVVQRVSNLDAGVIPSITATNSWFQMQKLDNPEVLILHEAIGGDTFDTAPDGINITFDTLTYNNSGYTFTPGGHEIKVLQSGFYKVSYSIGNNASGGRTSAYGKLMVKHGGSAWADSPYGWSHNNIRNSGGIRIGATSASTILNLSSNDLILLQIGRASLQDEGTNQIRGNEIHLDLEYLGPAQIANVIQVYDALGGDDLNAGPIDQTWDTKDWNGSDFTYTPTGSSITVERTGLYHIAYGIYTSNNTANARSEHVTSLLINGIEQSVCFGSGYNRGAQGNANNYESAGESSCYIELNSKDNITIRSTETTTTNPTSWLTAPNKVYLTIQSMDIDSLPPQYSNPTESPTDPATYTSGQTYQFNVTWTDDTSIETVIIQHNFTGTLTNYTVTGNTSNTYYYNYNDLSAGTYSWQMIANDTSGNANQTPFYTYTVNSGNPLTLLLNGSDGNYYAEPNEIINLTAYSQLSGNIELYREGILINNGTSPIANTTSFSTYGDYNITAINRDSNQNYSASAVTHYIIIRQDQIPQLHAIQGYVLHSDNTTQLPTGTNVTLNATTTGTFITVQTSGPPGHTGFYSTTINATDQEEVIAMVFNATHYGKFTTNILDSPSTTLLNITLNTTRPPETDLDILSPSNNTIYDILETFNITFNVTALGGSDSLNCNTTINISDTSIINLTSTQNSSISLGNIVLGSSTNDQFELEAISDGDATITLTSACASDAENFQNLNSETISLRIANQPTQLHAIQGYIFHSDNVTQVPLGTNVTINITGGAGTIVQTSGPPGHTGFYSTTILARDGDEVTVYSRNGTYEGNTTTTILPSPSVTRINVSRNIKIVPLDVTINSSEIFFSDPSPIEGTNVTINATILNIGRGDVSNVVVQFFNGDPNTTGIQIGSNQTIPFLARKTSTSINISFIPNLGPNDIYILIDPPLSSNGTIEEGNESNNQVNVTYNMPTYQTLYGAITGDLILGDNSTFHLLNWTNITNPFGNIYITDQDTTNGIDFLNLQPIGRNTTNSSTINDFTEIDSLLNMSTFNDSISNTYTTDGNTPISLENFTIFNKPIENIPIINSTNTSNFITGILWDKSDDTNGEYNTLDQEDIVFVSKINLNQPGFYGTYDYEITYPAKLREYNSPDTSTVYIYAEIE